MNTGVIVGMLVLGVASTVAEKVLTSMGKPDEAMIANGASKSMIAITALTIFAKLVKSLSSLG